LKEITNSKGKMMTQKITVTVSVPEGDYCETDNTYCDFWYRDAETKRCYCILFDMFELEQRYKGNMVMRILKCYECRLKCIEG